MAAHLNIIPPPVGGWKDDICDCCNHPRSACHGYWLWPCMVGQMQEKMVGPQGVCYQTACCAVALGFVPYVGGLAQWIFAATQAKNVLTRTRELYAIPGDDCNDCLCAFFCMTCSMCRVYRHVNDYHGADADKTVCCDCSATLDAPHPPTPAWAVQRPGVMTQQPGIEMQQPRVAYAMQPGAYAAAQPGVYAAQQPPIAEVAPTPYEPAPAKHVGTGTVVQGAVVQGAVVQGAVVQATAPQPQQPQGRFDPYTGQPTAQPGPITKR